VVRPVLVVPAPLLEESPELLDELLPVDEPPSVMVVTPPAESRVKSACTVSEMVPVAAVDVR
jgi:hypothetical protein